MITSTVLCRLCLCCVRTGFDDKRLTALLAHYWQNDALLQLLLHAVRVLMQHGPDQPTANGSKDNATASADDSQPAGATAADGDDAAAASPPCRAVGLPELLDAVRQFSKVGAWLHAMLGICSLQATILYKKTVFGFLLPTKRAGVTLYGA